MTYTPECLRNLPQLKSPVADAKKRKQNRALAELTILECIQRLRAEQRSKPSDWQRGYNSAITTLELFIQDVQAKRWIGTEGLAPAKGVFDHE
ncbi:hypothetical protein [Pseudomonas panipatensis]|uniref:hypothetical protein n=1 Tax=Pseudomonas panipatensis TaxID=428992 RepID=UPI001BAF3A83|nr:hypothetical protein [Pseudomonas panipatensis]